MRKPFPHSSLLLLLPLAACGGSSSGGPDSPSMTLAVTDAASERLSTFLIGLESVDLISPTNPPVSLLSQPVAVDFSALSDLSRVLNVAVVPPGVYTGVEVVLQFDGNRVVLSDDSGAPMPAELRDFDDVPLAGTMTLPVEFPGAIDVHTGNLVLELDLDLDQSLEVDAGMNVVWLEPTLVPRFNPTAPKERAVAGDLGTVKLDDLRFRIRLDAPLGAQQPTVTVTVDPTTVFQINGVCLVGLAGLSQLAALSPGDWVQAFGSIDGNSSEFEATTVEAGTGSYNGGSDIVQGLITSRAGLDRIVRGHSNDADHATFEFNLDFTVATDMANTKVVHRGSAVQYGIEELNVGQRVRMFGALGVGPGNPFDVTLPTDVVRLEPTHVYGLAKDTPAAGVLEIEIQRVDVRDASIFDWASGGIDPMTVRLSVGNLGVGKNIVTGTHVDARGFFSPVSDPNFDFVADTLVNLDDFGAALLLVRNRPNGLTVTTTPSPTDIELGFDSGPAVLFEKAVVDEGFVGTTDLTGLGITLVPSGAGVGFYTLRDRTLGSISLHFTFASFSQALDEKLGVGGATLYQLGALGAYDSMTATLTTALMGAVVE